MCSIVYLNICLWLTCDFNYLDVYFHLPDVLGWLVLGRNVFVVSSTEINMVCCTSQACGGLIAFV